VSVTAGIIIDPPSCDTKTDVREGVLQVVQGCWGGVQNSPLNMKRVTSSSEQNSKSFCHSAYISSPLDLLALHLLLCFDVAGSRNISTDCMCKKYSIYDNGKSEVTFSM